MDREHRDQMRQFQQRERDRMDAYAEALEVFRHTAMAAIERHEITNQPGRPDWIGALIKADAAVPYSRSHIKSRLVDGMAVGLSGETDR